MIFVRRPRDVLAVDKQPGRENGFIERHWTSYTPEWVQGRLHRHHSVQKRSLHLRLIKTVLFYTVSAEVIIIWSMPMY